MSTFKILSTQIYYSTVTFYMFYAEKRVVLLSYLSKKRYFSVFQKIPDESNLQGYKNRVFLVVIKEKKNWGLFYWCKAFPRHRFGLSLPERQIISASRRQGSKKVAISSHCNFRCTIIAEQIWSSRSL